ncbi:cytochrome P450 [Amycolatopsis dongchuanensis]
MARAAGCPFDPPPRNPGGTGISFILMADPEHARLRRMVTAPFAVKKVEVIRAGEGLILANEVGNRDPAVFEDPDRLDLTRDARRHVAFGFGVHRCRGQSLARLELQVVDGTLYRRIPTLRPATDLDAVPFKHDGSVYGVYDLPVIW